MKDMDKSHLHTASLVELELLLSSSKAQQEELAIELDNFVALHIDDLQDLCIVRDDRFSDEDLDLLTGKYPVLATLKSIGNKLADLEGQQSSISSRKLEDIRSNEYHDLLVATDVQIDHKQFFIAFTRLEDLKAALETDDKTRALPPSKVNELFDRSSSRQRKLLDDANQEWQHILFIEDGPCFRVTDSGALSSVIRLFEKLGTLQGKSKQLANAVHDRFIKDILTTDRRVSESDGSLLLGHSGMAGLPGVQEIFEFLITHVPNQVMQYICPQLVPATVHTIRNEFLPRELPSQPQALARIEAMTASLRKLEQFMQAKQLLKTNDLSDMAKDIPVLWSEKRRGVLLNQCRKIVLSWTGTTEMVEQNENVTQESLLTTVKTPVETVIQPNETSAAAAAAEEDDDWGASEWDIPEEPTSETAVNNKGFNETHNAHAFHTNLEESAAVDLGETVVLTTKYSISTIMKALLELIEQCKDESTKLQSSDSIISSQHASLAALETEFLDLYKALVPTLVMKTGYPRMTIYNDCIYMSSHSNHNIREFGERFYTLELHEKLTQIHQILDTTAGFTAVTLPSQKETCYAAIQGTLDLLTRTCERYEAQLGRTTLCTALGTLGDTSIAYFVDSVMEMTDISESESIELAKMGDTLSRLEDLFKDDSGGTVLTAMWCPNWFRFRLLLDILEAKLDYILQLWNDGDLVDFEPGEVVELIRALFSDSPKRRSAIDRIMANV